VWCRCVRGLAPGAVGGLRPGCAPSGRTIGVVPQYLLFKTVAFKTVAASQLSAALLYNVIFRDPCHHPNDLAAHELSLASPRVL